MQIDVGTNSFTIDIDGSNDTLEIELASLADFSQIALSGSGNYDSIKGWSGVGELRLGPKQGHLSVKQSFNPNGESSLAFGPQIHTDVVKAMAMLNMASDEMRLPMTELEDAKREILHKALIVDLYQLNY